MKLRRMNIPYRNEYMENVRLLAIKHMKELISEFVEEYHKISEVIGRISEEIEEIGEWDVKEDLVGLVNQLDGYLINKKKKWKEKLK